MKNKILPELGKILVYADEKFSFLLEFPRMRAFAAEYTDGGCVVTREYQNGLRIFDAWDDRKPPPITAHNYKEEIDRFAALIKKEIGKKNQAFFRAYTVDVEEESVIIRLRIAVNADKEGGSIDSILHAGGNEIRFFYSPEAI